MIVRARFTSLPPGHEGSTWQNTRWQITPDKNYLVYALGFGLFGEKSCTLVYKICDDYGALLPAHSALFEVADPHVSKSWVLSMDSYAVRLEPREFVENPEFTERVLDRESPEIEAFHELTVRLQNEHRR